MTLTAARWLARDLMKRHKLTEWKFKFDESKHRFGQCNFGKKTISISRYLTKLHEQRQVKHTILHEIAHALSPADARNHGLVFKHIARKIGGNGAATVHWWKASTLPQKAFWSLPVAMTRRGNYTCVKVGKLILHFSDHFCFAFQNGLHGVCSENVWDVKTGRYMNRIEPDKKKRVDNDRFNRDLESMLRKYGFDY